MTDRERAFHLLRRIDTEEAFATPLLHGESGFVRTVVLGVLRWRLRLDDAIEKLSSRRIAKLDASVVEILRIGIYQLMFTDVAEYAAVSESVDLAHRYAKRAGGLVNAVLRRASQTHLESLATTLATRTSHPEWLLKRWIRMYGEERAARIAEANQELSYPDVFGGEPPAASSPSILVPGMYKLTGSSAGAEGYALDEGSGVVADLTAATGKSVLDLAAAPGGKSIVMRARGANVVSTDISIARLRPLAARAKNLIVADGRAAPFRRLFDTVLIDAPCSATGTIRKNPELKWRLRESHIAQFPTLQKELLFSALALAKETVIYSTCSLEREENDEVVASVLASQKEFERVDAAFFANDEVKKWIEDGVLRLTPESGADGFTAFVLQRIN
jgi:16S rRNA (cytosine967-C5)-methyltransferase